MYKWQKEMNAWANGKRVQARRLGTEKPMPWVDLGKGHYWNLEENAPLEYRINELEAGKYYKIRFKGLPDEEFVVALLTGSGVFRWYSENGGCSTHSDSKCLKEITPEDQVK